MRVPVADGVNRIVHVPDDPAVRGLDTAVLVMVKSAALVPLMVAAVKVRFTDPVFRNVSVRLAFPLTDTVPNDNGEGLKFTIGTPAVVNAQAPMS